MKLFLIVTYGILLVWALAEGPRDESAAPVGRVPPSGVAVLELFTSEGCSSCPPADEVLGAIAKESGGKQVYALAMHVDYWDRLGWKDPYADAAFSERQRDYASVLRSANGVYTPQMIVNGHTEFVGSDRKRADAAVADALKAAAPIRVALTVTRAAGASKVVVEYRLSTAAAEGERALSAGAVLNVALVEDGLSTRVKAGENLGRTLAHERVVRRFTTIAIKDGREGAVEIEVPEGVAVERSEVIAFVQERSPGKVLGAASAKVGAAVGVKPGATAEPRGAATGPPSPERR
jgi:hypothetical protein